MAAPTILPKLACVHVRFTVAAVTRLVGSGKSIVGMTAAAPYCFMTRLQRKNGVMVEFHDRPAAIMTAQAVVAMLRAVLGDEFPIGIFVAGDAAHFVRRKTAFGVAIFANHLRTIEACFMMNKAEAA